MKIKHLLLSFFSLISVTFGAASFLITLCQSENATYIKVDNDSKGIFRNYYANTMNNYASFNNLDDALTNAKNQSGDIDIYMMPNNHVEFNNSPTSNHQELVINENTNLYLPYQVNTDGTYKCEILKDELASTSTSIADRDLSNAKSNMASSISLYNTKLTINGSLTIGGVNNGKGVTGKYSQINLDKESNIIVNGAINIYGYIKEKDHLDYEDKLNYEQENKGKKKANNEFIYDDNRYLQINAGATVICPIGVYDINKGTSQLQGLNSNGVCPVNIFDFPTIQTYFKVLGGALFQGKIKTYISAVSEPIDEIATIVAPSSYLSGNNKSLFILDEGPNQYISFEYCPITPGITNDDRSNTYISFSGTTTLGSLYFELIMGVKVQTDDKFLPISHKLNIIILDGATFNLDNRVKLLDGAHLEIQEGGTLNVNNSLIAYKDNTMPSFDKAYPTNCGDAQIINNGTMNVSNNGSLGGKIQTTALENIATIDLTNISSQDALSVSSKEGTTGVNINATASGFFYDAEEDVIAEYYLKAGEIITSGNNGIEAYWTKGFIATYLLKIIVANNDYEYPTLGYEVFSIDQTSSVETRVTPEGNLVMESMEIPIIRGDSFRINSSSRAISTYFSSQDKTDYVFTNNQVYVMSGNIKITIVPGEGVLCRFSSDGKSGNGSATKTILESPTRDGDYYQIGSSNNGVAVDVVVRKGYYITYRYEEGTGWSKVGYTYRHSGLKIVTNFTNLSAEERAEWDTLTDFNKDESKESGFTGNGIMVTNPILIDASYTFHTHLQAEGEDAGIEMPDFSSGGGGCFTPNTLVMMADGHKEEVKNLKVGDLIMTYNHELGKWEAQPIAVLTYQEAARHQVLDLYFANGNKIEVLFGHVFLNANTRLYDEIRLENITEYLGEEYLYKDCNELKKTKLINYEIREENTEVYSIVSAYNYNQLLDDMLCISDDIPGLYNYFELDENYNYDLAKMQADIAKYGLYTYEDFQDYISYEEFVIFNAKYLKVAVGKGLLTKETIIEYINKYLR